MRNKIVAGNWKMNLNLKEGIELADSVHHYFNDKKSVKAEVILCPPFIHLASLCEKTGKSKVKIGAQNCASEPSGAYTGEVSAAMIKSTGADYVIIGHSERRTYYKETDSLLNRKTVVALQNDLKVIFCCGEVLAEREANIHFSVVKGQLENGIFNLTVKDFGNIIIAYEPVWAIGTGVTASPEQAQEMHKFIRSEVEKKYGRQVAENTSILYGGSCKPSNAKEIFSKPDVDGGLIGGAALNKNDFCGIVDSF
jgi:triosephosphate isomerase